MYKIYFNNYVFYLLTPQKGVKKRLSINDFILYENNLSTFQELLNNIKSEDKISKIFILSPSPKKLFQKLFRETILIRAGGGMVLNDGGKLLMIKRNGIWDLPKGKSEKGEKISTTALREVEEECGIKNLVIDKKISSTFHVYSEKNKWFIKKSCWYKMFTNDKSIPVPQTKENITEVAWYNKEEVEKRLSNTYGNIRDLIIKYYLKK